MRGGGEVTAFPQSDLGSSSTAPPVASSSPPPLTSSSAPLLPTHLPSHSPYQLRPCDKPYLGCIHRYKEITSWSKNPPDYLFLAVAFTPWVREWWSPSPPPHSPTPASARWGVQAKGGEWQAPNWNFQWPKLNSKGRFMNKYTPIGLIEVLSDFGLGHWKCQFGAMTLLRGANRKFAPIWHFQWPKLKTEGTFIGAYSAK